MKDAQTEEQLAKQLAAAETERWQELEQRETRRAADQRAWDAMTPEQIHRYVSATSTKGRRPTIGPALWRGEQRLQEQPPEWEIAPMVLYEQAQDVAKGRNWLASEAGRLADEAEAFQRRAGELQRLRQQSDRRSLAQASEVEATLAADRKRHEGQSAELQRLEGATDAEIADVYRATMAAGDAAMPERIRLHSQCPAEAPE